MLWENFLAWCEPIGSLSGLMQIEIILLSIHYGLCSQQISAQLNTYLRFWPTVERSLPTIIIKPLTEEINLARFVFTPSVQFQRLAESTLKDIGADLESFGGQDPAIGFSFNLSLCMFVGRRMAWQCFHFVVCLRDSRHL